MGMRAFWNIWISVLIVVGVSAKRDGEDKKSIKPVEIDSSVR